GFSARLFTHSSVPPQLPAELIIRELPKSAGLIVRDMRDSSGEEIRALQRIAPVAVIDDRGTGRAAADKAIDLLPHPEQRAGECRSDAFLYGYEFVKSLEGLGSEPIGKDIPFVMYQSTGSMPSCAPPELPGIILARGGRFKIGKGGALEAVSMPYARVILAANVIVSHFGIIMYEGFLGGASLVALNPGGYHNRLTDCAHELNIINCGLLESADVQSVHDTIRREAAVARPAVSPDLLRERLRSCTKNFVELLKAESFL
ncbi:MAG: hypothetical protein LBT84_05235, partial [Spirochaetia bacterium]|nr:hypothetical protein [Spirochaetia bacterium]